MALKSVNDLFYQVGGSVHLAALLNLNQYTVDRWERSGIPEKYWRIITTKFNISREDLAAISAKAKRLHR